MTYYKNVSLNEKIAHAKLDFHRPEFRLKFILKGVNVEKHFSALFIIYTLMIDLGVLDYGEHFSLLDFLAEMPVFCYNQKN